MLTIDHLKRALAKASECQPPSSSSPGSVHQARSREWVGCLAREFAGLYADDPHVRVFHKGDDKNRDDFGLNELLYDICVCQTAECDAPRNPRKLRYVTKALWQIESEFARDASEAVKDFNKLVIGSAENKLFIGPRLSADMETKYLDALLPVARCCGTGSVYAALVPHPDAWDADRAGVALWRLVNREWEQDPHP